MLRPSRFSGFQQGCLNFFAELAVNNNKAWFDAHKAEYEKEVLAPARAFVVAMGARLQHIAPAVKADPRVNKSLFRIYRDVRFSRDKSPYKTHMGLWFWEGGEKRMACPGFYFHLEPAKMMLGCGFYQFPPHVLDAYRQAVVHPAHGTALAAALEDAAAAGFGIGGQHYKRVPRGFDAGHPNVELLLHTGLYVYEETEVPDVLQTSALPDYCFERYAKMAPVHEWLVALLKRARE